MNHFFSSPTKRRHQPEVTSTPTHHKLQYTYDTSSYSSVKRHHSFLYPTRRKGLVVGLPPGCPPPPPAHLLPTSCPSAYPIRNVMNRPEILPQTEAWLWPICLPLRPPYPTHPPPSDPPRHTNIATVCTDKLSAQ